MGLKYYLNLLKSEENNLTLTKRYRINTLLFIAFFALLIAYFANRGENIVLGAILAFLAFSSILFMRLLGHRFDRLVETMIASEQLSETNDAGEVDEINSAFIKYRTGYADYRIKNKKQQRLLLPLNILGAVLFIGIIPATAVLDLAGKTQLADKIDSVLNIAALVYLVGFFALTAFYARGGIWTQEYFLEIAIINKYKMDNGSTSVKKYKISEDKKPLIQLEYLFTDDSLRRKYIGLQKAMLRGNLMFFPGYLLMAILLVSIASQFPDSDFAFSAVMASIWTVAGLWIATLITFGIVQSRILKKQYKLLQNSPEEGALQLQLHKLRSPFVRRWNIIIVAGFFAAAISNIIFGSIITHFFSDNWGLFFFALFWVEFISIFVFYFKYFSRVRQQMIPIEEQIDTQKAAAALAVCPQTDEQSPEQ